LVKYEACGARLDGLERTPALTAFSVPHSALVSAGDEGLVFLAVALAGLTVEGVEGATVGLLGQTGADTGDVLGH